MEELAPKLVGLLIFLAIAYAGYKAVTKKKDSQSQGSYSDAKGGTIPKKKD